MDGDWAHLARQLARARKVAGLTQGELAEALGVGLSTVQKMERPGVPWAKVSPTHRLAARYLGWTDDSIDRVLAGGEPVMAEGAADARLAQAADAQQSAFEELTAGMSDRAIEALRRGRTVDTVVVDLAPDDPDTVAVLIYKRGASSDASPERKRRDLQRWSRLQRAALEIFSEQEGPNP